MEPSGVWGWGTLEKHLHGTPRHSKTRFSCERGTYSHRARCFHRGSPKVTKMAPDRADHSETVAGRVGQALGPSRAGGRDYVIYHKEQPPSNYDIPQIPKCLGLNAHMSRVKAWKIYILLFCTRPGRPKGVKRCAGSMEDALLPHPITHHVYTITQ